MVTIKYNDRVLIPSIEPGESKTIHSHNFKMPGNFTVEAAHGWIEPGEEGKY